MPTAIEFENISKQYRLGLVSTRTLSHDLNRWFQMNIRGKEDPYLKIGEVNDRAHRGESDYVWALKDINFKVEQGDVLGIIGKNGAGKSTLLKILSKVTSPTTGTIKARGRIASLLEVGTGFHPEMTGRENIFMNGAIMGMSKSEIRRKLDEIVDFSGVERYLDTPVKRYSSGMTVRLGFAIAAHLDPEILVVDEVLAVGDAEFQKKAIGKMQDVSKGEGRTVLFVSHNMGAVRSLCTKGVLLEDGQVTMNYQIDSVVDFYLHKNIERKNINLKERNDRSGNGRIILSSFDIVNPTIQLSGIKCGDDLTFKMCLFKSESNLINNVWVAVNILSTDDCKILQLSNRFFNNSFLIEKEFTYITFNYKRCGLKPGRYYIRVFLSDNYSIFDWINHVYYFDVYEGDFYQTGFMDNSSLYHIDHTVYIESNK